MVDNINQQERRASEEIDDEEPRTSVSRTCLVVLGMHRSGTSALTGTLGILGATLPNDLLGSHPSNVKGHFESYPIYVLNEQFLTALNTYWYDVAPIDFSTIDSATLDRFRTELVGTLQTAFDKSSLFALKDPRISRLFPLTVSALEELGASVRVIICVRNPLEVAKSLEARDAMALSHGLALWLRYMLEAELHSRGLPRVFVQFSDLLQDWRSVVAQIEQRLGVALPRCQTSADEVSAFLDKSLRHQLAEENVRQHPSAWACYQAFVELVHNPDDSHLEHQLDQLRITFDQHSQLFGEVVKEYYRELRDIWPRLSAAEEKFEELEKLKQQQVLELEARISAAEEKFEELEKLKQQQVVELEARISAAQEKFEELEKLRQQQVLELEARISATEEKIEELEKLKQRKVLELEVLGEHVESLGREVESLREQNSLIRKKMQRLKGKNRKKIAKLKQEKTAILASRSWRLTAPLRKIESWLAVFGFSRGR
jgi:hypothetical protein